MLNIHSSVRGTGVFLPEKVLTNYDLEKMVDTNDEWIFSRTGIKERRISEMNTSEIGSNAVKDLLKNTGVDPLDIELIIFCTLTPDNNTPSSACLVQKSIGAKNATSFDINAACSGFIYGIVVADSMIKTGNYKNAVIIGSEVLSKVVDWTDRNTCVLFGDGAGAILLEKSNSELGVIDYYTKSVGEKNEVLVSKGTALKNYLVDKSEGVNPYITMDGREVFKFAVSVIVESVIHILEKNNLSIDDIKFIVPHQANIRIINFSAEKLNVSPDKFYTNLERFGNTSAASIPIALNEMVASKKLVKGDLIIIVGFGGGLTYGASLIRW